MADSAYTVKTISGVLGVKTTTMSPALTGAGSDVRYFARLLTSVIEETS